MHSPLSLFLMKNIAESCTRPLFDSTGRSMQLSVQSLRALSSGRLFLLKQKEEPKRNMKSTENIEHSQS